MTIINFREHKFRKEGKYKCNCGYKFKRGETTYWTENPFNTKWKEGKIKELNEECNKTIEKYLKEKKCPKCGLTCKILCKNLK